MHGESAIEPRGGGRGGGYGLVYSHHGEDNRQAESIARTYMEPCSDHSCVKLILVPVEWNISQMGLR